MSDGPLVGIRVVEHATVLMGPYVAQLLGDLGADVIKVEGDVVDASRMMGAGPHAELSGVALNLHRNKRSIRLNLKSPDGMNVLNELIGRADVFVTNARPRSLRALGIDYNSLSSRYPRLVYCETHGYRSDSSEADRPAFDDIIQAETGIPNIQSLVGLGINYLPMVIADKIAGMTAAYAVAAALVGRSATGKGGRVEVPMFDSMLSFTLVEHLSGAATPGGSSGYSRLLTPERRPYPAKDGHVALLPYSDQQWKDLYVSVGREDELEDPRFASRASRNRNSNFVYASLARLVAERTVEEVMSLCDGLDVPAGRVPSLEQLVKDPSLNRGVVRQGSHPEIGPYRDIRPAAIFDGQIAEWPTPAPLIGANTVEVLQELGIASVAIEGLLASGAATQR